MNWSDFEKCIHGNTSDGNTERSTYVVVPHPPVNLISTLNIGFVKNDEDGQTQTVKNTVSIVRNDTQNTCKHKAYCS